MAERQALEAIDDYSTIEAAVMETARGRWFLSEYARRNRHADTQMLLSAITRLETLAVQGQASAAPAVQAPDTSEFAAALRHAVQEAQAAIMTEARGVGPDGEKVMRAAILALQQVSDRVLLGAPASKPAAVRPLRPGEFDLDVVAAHPADTADVAMVDTARAPEKMSGARLATPQLALAAMAEESAREAELARELPRRPALRASDLDSLTFEEKSVFFA